MTTHGWNFGVSDILNLPSSQGTGYVLAPDGAGGLTWIATSSIGVTDHGALTGLLNDDHTQYALLAGRAGGQTIYGGTAANEDLSISGTSHATTTTSYVLLQPSGGNVGIGTSSPNSLLHASVSTANTSTAQQVLTLSANSTGTAAAGFGSRILWELESDTTDDQTAATFDVKWAIATHATRRSYVLLQVVTGGVLVRLLHNYSSATSNGANLFLGTNSGNFTMSPGGGAAGLASNNTGFGANTLSKITTGNNNVGIGTNALFDLTEGYSNVGIGPFALENVTTGINNFAMGDNAGASLTTGSRNTIIGAFALTNNDANGSVAIGNTAGRYETGAAKLFIDNTSRANEADGRIKTLVYGEFHADPVSQLFRTNAVTQILMTDAATTTATTVHKLNHNSTGTAAAGFGTTQQWLLQSSTTADTAAANLTVTWATATHASRKARIAFTPYDTAAREALRLEASGSAPMIGFFGGGAVVQQVLAAYTSDGEGSAYTGIDNLQVGTVYAQLTDLNALRVAYETLRASYDDLRSKLLTSTLVA